MSFARDTVLKKGFERTLRPRIQKELRKYAKDVAKAISTGGPGAVGLVAVDTAAIEASLLTHYNSVGRVFGRQLTNRFPNPISVTGIERAVIESNLTEAYAARASSQAQLITRTTIKNAQRSIASQLKAAGDVVLDDATLGRSVGRQLTLQDRARVRSISLVETQSSAETAKGIEAAVVTPNPAAVTKTWVTVGDSRVRDAHLSADGQTVPVDSTFTVKGESLMFPGDSNGSPSNIINCRCSSQINDAEIISQRSNL